MALTGAVSAAVRKFDPWQDFDEVYDFAGLRNQGLPFFKTADRRRMPNLRSVPDTSFTRATTAIVIDDDGSLREVASGEPAIRRGRGLEIHPSIQNKLTNWNFPTAGSAIGEAGYSTGVVTKVARADLPAPVKAALEARDPRGLVTHVLRLTGTTHPFGVNFTGQVGNTNTHTIAVFAFVAAGSAQLTFTDNGSPVALASGFARTATTGVPADTIRGARIRSLDSAADVYFFGHSLTETAYAPPVIPVSGAAATRNADVHQRSGLALNPLGFTVFDQGTFEARLQNSYAWQLDGTGDRCLVQSTSSDSIRGFVSVGGVSNNLVGPVISTSAPVRSALRCEAGTWDLFVNGVKYAGGAFGSPAGISTWRLGQFTSLAFHRRGTMAATALRNRPGLSDAAALALTSP